MKQKWLKNDKNWLFDVTLPQRAPCSWSLASFFFEQWETLPIARNLIQHGCKNGYKHTLCAEMWIKYGCQVKRKKREKKSHFAALTRRTLGGYQIPQYRTVPVIENRRKTNTAFKIGHAYLKLYPSRVFVFLKHVYVYTRNQPHSHREKTWEDLELIGTTIEKPGHWISYQFYHRITVTNCVIIYR